MIRGSSFACSWSFDYTYVADITGFVSAEVQKVLQGLRARIDTELSASVFNRVNGCCSYSACHVQ